MNGQQHSVILQQLYFKILTVSDMCDKTLQAQYASIGIFMLAHKYFNVSILCFVSEDPNVLTHGRIFDGVGHILFCSKIKNILHKIFLL